HQAHAAVDVVADTAGRNDTSLVRVSGADSADREPVAPVNVGHRQAGNLDAGEEGNVGDLVGGLVTLYLLDHLVAGIDEPVDAHPGLIRLRNAPAALADALERTAVGVFHGSVPKSILVRRRNRKMIEDGGWKMAGRGSR